MGKRSQHPRFLYPRLGRPSDDRQLGVTCHLNAGVNRRTIVSVVALRSDAVRDEDAQGARSDEGAVVVARVNNQFKGYNVWPYFNWSKTV